MKNEEENRTKTEEKEGEKWKRRIYNKLNERHCSTQLLKWEGNERFQSKKTATKMANLEFCFLYPYKP